MSLNSEETRLWQSGNLFQKVKETGLKLLGHWLKQKKTNSLKKVILETMSVEHSSRPCSGSCPFTLGFVQGMKSVSYVGEM